MGEEAGTSHFGNREISLVTRNRHKFDEARSVLAQFGIRLRQLRRSKVEIQSSNLADIARFAVGELTKTLHIPLCVEDSGLFIDELNGFPGPFSAYAYDTLGTSGVLRIMGTKRNRKAHFQAAVAVSTRNRRCRVFTGRVYGRISRQESGNNGFGFDPIFIPSGSDRTFGEMSLASKSLFSHRAIAFRMLATWHNS